MGTVLKTVGLTKRYKDNLALNDVSIELEAGRIYGLIGNNGAGKSTLIQIIAGLIEPTSGACTLFESCTSRENRMVRRRIGFLFTESWLSEDMTALQNLISLQKLMGYHDRNEAETLLCNIGLEKSKIQRERIKTFSTGQRQRVAIAAALLNQPDFLVLDEPLSGLDFQAIQVVTDILRNECKTRNTTILISDHNLSYIHNLATDYIFLHQGRILENLDNETLRGRQNQNVWISVDSLERAQNLIQQTYPGLCVENDGSRLKIKECVTTTTNLVALLAKNHVEIKELSAEDRSLENYFAYLLGEQS